MEEIMQIFLRKKSRAAALLTLFGALVLLTLAPARAQQQTLPALDQIRCVPASIRTSGKSA
jgi:hypothetical protein